MAQYEYPYQLTPEQSEELSVMRQAIEVYGDVHQMLIAIEEMAELIKEICKRYRGFENYEAIAEEIADVSVVTDELKLIFKCSHHVNAIRREKIHRLKRVAEIDRKKPARSHNVQTLLDFGDTISKRNITAGMIERVLGSGKGKSASKENVRLIENEMRAVAEDLVSSGELLMLGKDTVEIHDTPEDILCILPAVFEEIDPNGEYKVVSWGRRVGIVKYGGKTEGKIDSYGVLKVGYTTSFTKESIASQVKFDCTLKT